MKGYSMTKGAFQTMIGALAQVRMRSIAVSKGITIMEHLKGGMSREIFRERRQNYRSTSSEHA